MANSVIYETKGEAREYAPLAFNMYKGCTHKCGYCFGPGTMRMPSEQCHRDAQPKARILERLRRDAEALRGDDREIMLSFIGDPYQPTEMELELTRRSIEILIENGLRFSILTKGGTRAARDFDLLASYGKARFGSTIIFKDQEYADTWEPGAAPIQDRIEAIWQAQGKGISTWVSVEPIVSPGQAFEVIRLLHPIVDHWKVGKLNYMDAPERPNWRKVRSEIAGLLDSLGADYYIKNSLRRY